MSNFFGAGSGRVNKPVLPATALRVQSAANGVPIPVLHGRNRLAGNMLDYEGFAATPVSDSTAGGGKGGVLGGGGGKGSQQPTSYTYSTNVIFGLCEGAVALILRVWNNKSATTPAGLNFTGFAGSIGQAIWSWWEASYPNTALGYSALAYVAANPIDLGTAPEMANLNWEVQSVVGNAVVEFHTLSPGAGQSVIPAYFNLADSTTEQVTIPVAPPYQIQAQNPTAVTALPVIDGAVSASPLTNSAGVIYANTGAPFTRVASAPTAGQYSVTQAGLYSFAAADAGQMVTIIDLAVGQAQYIVQPTGDTVLGNPVVTGLSSTAGIAQGQLVTGAGIAAGTVVQNAIGSGSFTGTTHAGSTLVDGLSAGANPVLGSLIRDSAGAVPANATIAAVTPAMLALDQNAQADAAGDSIFLGLLCSGSVSPGGAMITSVSPTTGIAIGQGFDDAGGPPLGSVFPATAVVIGISGSTVTMSAPAINSSSGEFFFTAIVTADLAIGDATLTNISSTGLLAIGMEVISDTAGALPNGGTIQALTPPSFNLSVNATASVVGDSFAYPAQVTLSPAPVATASGVPLTFWGANLIQVTGNPGGGQFSINVYEAANYGEYVFGDTVGSVAIVDVPDADPAASLSDFLTNPRYGCGFPAANLGDLSLLQNYAYATGLFISPAIVASQAASSYLQDFSIGLNGEFVWSAGLLSFVPYGDATVSGNGKTYTPPVASGPIYALTDDDYLPNEGTSAVGVSAFTSDDPIVCVRKRQSDALNDVKVEYLDRGNSYNPAIVEAKDDAAIGLFGLRPADTKTLHFFCIETAALQSAQLQLGRQQIRNQYSFTVPWYFILLDPMDIIAITDAALGLAAQLVRVLEITENQEDWSLTLTTEEVLDGTGATPRYGSQVKAGYTANYNLPPGTPVAPVIFEPPVRISESGGLEVWLLTGAAANYGGADVSVSSDGATYKRAGRISGGTSRIGVTTADLPAAPDPDTTDTLAIDLTATAGSLLSGTRSDADLGHTLCVLGGYPYAAAPSLSAIAGGALTAATYYARATYVFATGEGPPSPEDSLAVPASMLLVAAAPAAQNGAIGWNIYVGLAPGAETLQNATPIAIGTGWTEPGNGLVTGASPPPTETGYELISYENAVLTVQYRYALGTYLRRGLYGTTISDHPAGSSFARIDGTQLVYAYDKSQIGQTIFFKLTPFNQWGGGEPNLASVQPYAYTLQGPPAPNAITGFSAQQSGGAVIFAWNDLSGDGFIAYDLLYGPQGATVASATFLTQAGRGTEMTNASVPPGAWTFYIRGHDTLSGLVGPAAAVDLTIANLNAIIVAAEEGPDWLGEKDGFLLHHTGVLVPDSTMRADQLTNAQLFETFVAFPVADPSYTCANTLDTGLIGNFRAWASWAAAAGGNSANESGEIAFQLDAWQSADPANYAPWGNTGIATNQRYARGRIVQHTAVPAFISALSVTADSPVATYAIPSLAVASSGTTLTFAATAAAPPLPSQFHTPPTIQVTPNSGTAITGTATSVTDTACLVTLYDATGTAVAGTASLIIAGA